VSNDDAVPTAPGRPPEGDWLGTPFLRFERRGSIGLVTVDRPHRRNAMTPAMYFGARYAVDHVNRSDDLAALVFTGVGDVFIPGGDLGGDQEDGWGGGLELFSYDLVPFESIRNSAKPVVSAVNGICQGGGLLIAMFSDVAVAAPSATFRAPEVLRGIADTGYAAALPAQIGIPRARDMLLTGRTIDATTALDWGLITRLSTEAALLDDAIEVARQLARGGPNAYRAVKREVNRTYPRMDRMSMDESLASDEPVEGFHAFRERRSPAWVPDDLRLDGRL
jgi:enoyl-CoA hydratase/carnithine racemase